MLGITSKMNPQRAVLLLKSMDAIHQKFAAKTGPEVCRSLAIEATLVFLTLGIRHPKLFIDSKENKEFLKTCFVSSVASRMAGKPEEAKYSALPITYWLSILWAAFARKTNQELEATDLLTKTIFDMSEYCESKPEVKTVRVLQLFACHNMAVDAMARGDSVNTFMWTDEMSTIASITKYTALPQTQHLIDWAVSVQSILPLPI